MAAGNGGNLRIFVVLLLTATTGLVQIGALSYEETVYRDALGLIGECGRRSLIICFKERALKYVERLPNTMDIGGTISIKPNEVDRLPRLYGPLSLPEDPTAREILLDKILLERIAEYLSTHTLEMRMPTEAMRDLRTTMDEGRKKKQKGKKGYSLPLLMMFQLKAAALAAIAMKVIGMVAFKALIVAKVAFTIASIVALKKLVDVKPHTSTYEVLTHPVHEDYSQFDRSFAHEGGTQDHNVS